MKGETDMKKRDPVLFCRLAWMKHYQGITEDDQPLGGGRWVKENNDAHESDNFRPYNHVCRGFVQTKSGSININRLAQEKGAEAKGVTVIFVAKHPEGSSYIVGWYRNATVFRRGKQSLEPTRNDGTNQEYYFTAAERDCVLLPESERIYEIPRAADAGAGKGMGQAHVWYADEPQSENTRQRALDYISTYKGPTEKFFYMAEELKACAEDSNLSVDEIIQKSFNAQTLYEALLWANLAVRKECSYETLVNRASILEEMRYLDEAEPDYRSALCGKPNDPLCMQKLQHLEYLRENFAQSAEIGEHILAECCQIESETIFDLCDALWHIGQYEKSLALWNQHEVILRKAYGDDAYEEQQNTLQINTRPLKGGASQ